MAFKAVSKCSILISWLLDFVYKGATAVRLSHKIKQANAKSMVIIMPKAQYSKARFSVLLSSICFCKSFFVSKITKALLSTLVYNLTNLSLISRSKLFSAFDTTKLKKNNTNP